jgi:hypothetical protein
MPSTWGWADWNCSAKFPVMCEMQPPLSASCYYGVGCTGLWAEKGQTCLQGCVAHERSTRRPSFPRHTCSFISCSMHPAPVQRQLP